PHLFALPSRRSSDLGWLLQRVETELPEHVRTLRLFTGEHSLADQRLYARHGYTETAALPPATTTSCTWRSRCVDLGQRGRGSLALTSRAASSTVVAIRFSRVRGRFAWAIHTRTCRRADGGKAAKLSRAARSAARRRRRSSGTTRSCGSASALQVPVRLAC